MNQRHRAVFFGLCLVTLFVVGRLTTGSLTFITSDFWFASGLLMLILLAVVDQPHFSKDANVFNNGVTGLAALLAVHVGKRDWLWLMFFGWSWLLVGASYALILTRSNELKSEPAIVRITARVVRTIGRPQALFSAFFLWGVFTQFRPDSSAYRALLLFWSVFMILNLPGVASAIVSAWLPSQTETPHLARIRNQVAPRLIELELSDAAPAMVLGKVAVFSSGDELLYRGTVIDERSVAGLRTASVILAAPPTAQASSASNPVVQFEDAPSTDSHRVAVGMVCAGTTTMELHVNVSPGTKLAEGRLLCVNLDDRSSAFYQIVSARVAEEAMERARGFHQIGVRGAQLGRWSSETAQFAPVQWVPPPGEVVISVPADGQLATVPAGRYPIGRIPSSPFPVHVALEDVVTHNTAILGVTGSGKSYLSFHLTRGLAAAGVKVLILDASRQHFIQLADLKPQSIRSVAELGNWLTSEDKVGVHQFATATNYPSTTAEYSQKVFDHLTSTVTLQAGQNEPARFVIVLEEAHSLIPEWNQVAQKGDEQHVNRTARVLISQRTANVTKTILNQCNTIFALQSFDQTGLDFLHNYMGSDYAQSLSTLPPRHAVLVGKASCSPRPLILAFDTFV